MWAGESVGRLRLARTPNDPPPFEGSLSTPPPNAPRVQGMPYPHTSISYHCSRNHNNIVDQPL